MFEAQQPYIPVCLMTAAVMGTEYYYHLHTIRSFRDRVIYGRMGYGGILLADLYYGLSSLASEYVNSHRNAKRLVLHGIVRPLGYLLERLS